MHLLVTAGTVVLRELIPKFPMSKLLYSPELVQPLVITDLNTYRLARELRALPMDCTTVLEGQLDLYPKLLHLIRLRPLKCRLALSVY